MPDRFTGFLDGVALLDSIGAMTKSEFASAKSAWTDGLLDPTRLLVAELGEHLRSTVSPTIEADPKINGSISPITRDLRFASDKSRPYKDHLLLNFWDGRPKRSAPTMRLRIAHDSLGFAAGAAFDPAGLKRWRAAVTSDAVDDLVAALDELGRRRDLRFSDPELKRVPSGSTPTSDWQARLARHKTFQVRFLEPIPPSITTAEFVSMAASRLDELGILHLWLKAYTR